MKVEPLSGIVQLKIEEAKAGNLITSSKESAIEFAEVMAIGEGVNTLKVGDKVFVKAWGIDIVTYNEERFYFCNLETKAILAIVED